MSTLLQAHNQWKSRPSDERFLSLADMQKHFDTVRLQSRSAVVPSRWIQAEPVEIQLEDIDGVAQKPAKALVVTGPDGKVYEPTTGATERKPVINGYEPTHWAFGQLCSLAGAPAQYLRTLPIEMAADCLNFGFQINREIQDIGVLTQMNGSSVLRSATGPNYGRIWNSDVITALVSHVGDGITGRWKVPGEFRQAVTVTKENTTLYASDRDFFVFLADEENRIDVPNRRNGKTGSLARGFFIWNSEVGAKTFGVGTFLYDFVCCNRMIWGATGYDEIRIRHTASAPDRFLDEVTPALQRYAESSSEGITAAIKDAQSDRLGDKVDEFLATRFSRGLIKSIKAVHQLEEGRPIETRWDAIVGATARARAINQQDDRIELERLAGNLLKN